MSGYSRRVIKLTLRYLQEGTGVAKGSIAIKELLSQRKDSDLIIRNSYN